MSLKQWWKSLKGWQKGGLIGVVIHPSIATFSLIEIIINMNRSYMGTIDYWIIMILHLNLRLYNNICALTSRYLQIQNGIHLMIIFILMFSVAYFSIGALVGLVIEKIKR